MNNAESKQCFNEQIRKRWPRWTPSEVEISDWLTWLEAFDYPAVTAAARKHLAESRYAKPIPSALLEHARKAQPSKPKPQRDETANRTSSLPAEHVFIMCVAKDFDGCGPVGHYLPVLMWPFSKSYTAEEYLRTAEAFARKHADFYGGVWEVFADTNQLEIMRKSREIRDTLNGTSTGGTFKRNEVKLVGADSE